MKKFLLVALTTSRKAPGDDEPKRVRFPAKTTQDLTKAELEQLDALTVSTGKLHYREPVNESADAADDDADLELEDFTVKQLKAYLTTHGVEFDDKANKAALLKLAQGVEEGDDDSDSDDDDDNTDPDGGL